MKNIFTLCIIILPFYIAKAQAPSGVVAYYPLNNSADDVSDNNYDGTLTATSATSDRFGTSGQATAFESGTSTGTLPETLQQRMKNSFSFSFWFRTGMTARTGAQWYHGNSIFDAEVCGVTNDWGISLIDGGKVSFGIGNPDKTIKSSSSYNDGEWHFLTAVRNQSAGSIALYVDGTNVASTTGTNSNDLTAPSNIHFGKNNCISGSGDALYTGDLDEVIVYDRALSSTEAGSLYTFSNSNILPLTWVSFTGDVNKSQVTLRWSVASVINNKLFEIEQSVNGIAYTKIGTVANDPARSAYSFTVSDLSDGKYFYRIKQIDTDLRSSFSPTIAIQIKSSTSSFSLLFNPVNTSLSIKNPQQAFIKEISIFDNVGRLTMRNRIESRRSIIEINTVTLPGGYYVVRINSQQNNISLLFVKR